MSTIKYPNSWTVDLVGRIKLLAADNPGGFAKKCGISDQSFRKYLNGSIPGGDKILMIAAAGKVSTDWLLTGQEKKSVTVFTSDWPDDLKNLCLDLKEILETADEVSIAALKMNMAMIKGAVKDRNEKVALNKRIKVLEKEVKDLKLREPHGCAEAPGDYLPAADKKVT